MLTSWIQKWINERVFMAVEHTGQSQDNLLLFLVLENNKDTLNIINSGSVQSIKDLKGQMLKKIGLSLVINTDKVLTKFVKGSLNSDEVLLSAFPTLKLSDFYYEIVRNEEISSVSVCRKSDVEKILSEYEKNNLHIISLSLGNSAVFQLENYIKNDSVQTSNATVSFDNNCIDEIETNNHSEKVNYQINDLEILNTQILAFSSILADIEENSTQNNFAILIDEKKNQYNQQRFFQKGIQLGFGFIFILLLINMLFFSSYRARVNQLEQENTSNQQTKQRLLKVEKEVNSQKKLINEMFQSSGTHTTYILDDLVSVLPKTISLKTIQYQPILKKIKPAFEISINKNDLIIEGSTISDAEFTNWIKLLEQRQWITSVVIIEYGIQKSTTNFKIKIQIKDEWKIKE